LVAIMRLSPKRREELNGQTFGDWLSRHGQTATAVRDFWDLIVVPTLNARADEASAAQALFVFQEGFLKSPGATAIGIPAVGLSRLHVEPAMDYIRSRGGSVRLGCAVERLEVCGGANATVAGIVLGTGERLSLDAY